MDNLSLFAAAFAGGITAGSVGGIITEFRRRRRERAARKEVAELAQQATDALLNVAGMTGLPPGWVGGKAKVTGSAQVTGVESVNVREFFDALDAADLPTPGCDCTECDARRMRRAAADVKRDGQ